MKADTDQNLWHQAKLALGIAQSRKKPIVLLVGGVPIMFSNITKVKDSDTASNIVHVYGRVVGAFVDVFHKEIDHWVSIDLNRVDAIIDRDLGCLEDDILSEFD